MAKAGSTPVNRAPGPVAATPHGGHQQTRRADDAADGSLLAGFMAHELRDLINRGLLAFDVLKTAHLGLESSAGAVLHRSLIGMRALVLRSLAEIRLDQNVLCRVPFAVSDMIDEVAAAANLEAPQRGLAFRVIPAEPIESVDGEVAIEADRQLVTGAIGNLLQNAFKFTRPRTTVTLRVVATAERVSIEIQDECGGLDVDDPALFRPFEQRGADRTGLGLGLTFCQRIVDAHDGRLYARTLPHEGCVFVVELPRLRG